MSRTRQAIGAFCALLVFALCASGCADILGFQAGKPFPPDTSSIDASADVSVDGSDGNREGGSGGADSGGTKEAGGDCAALDNPANGLVTVPTLTLGSMATYSCILGAQLMDSPTRICQSDGTWSGTAPTCALKDCGPLTAPKDGSVDAPQTTYGAIATYSCSAGLGPSGSSTRSCQLDGTWSGTQPTCVIANCPALPGPMGGSVVAPTLTFGAMANYACDSGYTFRGAVTRTCQPDGTWSGTAPTCVVNDCGALKTPSNGTVSMTGTTYGSIASFTCDVGYTLSGSAIVTCQPNSTWSAAPPTCVIKDCGALTAPTNGAVDTTVTTFGSSATYSCATGYGLVGSATRTCGVGAIWSGTAPTCALKDCGPLVAPTNGSVTATVTTYGATATYSCTTGYGPSGSATRTCTADGTWDGTAPTCVVANCPALAGPAGGSVSAPTLTFGSTATYSCGTGYGLTGTATRTCQPDGTWSGASPTCTIKDCGAVTAPTSGTVSAPVTTYSSVATYACNTGYAASGPLTRTCQGDGTWSGTAPACTIKNCGALVGPTNGAVSAPVTTYGSMASYTCNTGYTVSDAVTRTCQADGTWSGTAPTCLIKDCGPLTPPMNGAVNAPITTYNATATYSCAIGYGPSGSATRTCQADGNWSGVAPTCVIANCPGLQSPVGGSVSAPALTFGSTATYVCNAGYLLNGPTTRTCQANSLWSGNQPTCDPKDCGAPGKPTHGSVVATATTYQSTATYSCDSGYILSGSITRTCQSDQTWSSTVPACLPVDCGVPSAIANGSPTFTATVLGSSATYSCVTNFTIAPGVNPTVTCETNGQWSMPRPSCVDICTVAGNVGTASHCCTNAACPGAAPVCNATQCVAKALGAACSPGECGNNPCVAGRCCENACNGTCDTQTCDTGGRCQHKSARTSCGTRTGAYPGFSDIALFCDGVGNCVGPTFRCGSTSACTLTANECCTTSPSKTSTNSGDPIVFSCTARSSCTCGDGSCDQSTNTNHRWHGCLSSIDCPTGTICADHEATFGALGFEFYECIPISSFDHSIWTVELCDPTRSGTQCTSGGTCTSFGDPSDPTAGGCG